MRQAVFIRTWDQLQAFLNSEAMTTKVRYTHRIRRCNGDRSAWCLIALRDDGTEIDSFGGYTTAMSIDALLRHSKGLLPGPDDVVQLVYYSPED